MPAIELAQPVDDGLLGTRASCQHAVLFAPRHDGLKHIVADLRSSQIGKVDPRRGFRGLELNERPALDPGQYFALQEAEDLAHIILMRRLGPIARGHGEDDQRAGDRDAPVVFAVAVDPFIDDGPPAARESRQPFRKLISYVDARQPQAALWQLPGRTPARLRIRPGLRLRATAPPWA